MMFIRVTTYTGKEYIFGDAVIKQIRVAYDGSQYDDFVPEHFFEILREWHVKTYSGEGTPAGR